MLDSLAHRGPDGRGVKALNDGRVLLGHRRLAIIDLSPAGAQPMTNEDESIWLTFNGEIYNFLALRKKLEERGHCFRSHADSEVILHAYEEWGDQCVDHLRGIFAFGLWDTRRQRLLLARDPLGVKPLYYARYGDRFSFASQPKAIAGDPDFPRHISAAAFSGYLAFGYVPHEQAIFEGMSKLPAGHLAILERGALYVRRYWQLPALTPYSSVDEAIDSVQHNLLDAVRAQVMADVPLGCFLSGGIDSSLLVSLATSAVPALRTFTIGFNESASDEREYARGVARHFGTQHFESVVDRPGVERSLWALQEHFDEPFDPNGPLPFCEVARLARKSGTVVALGGDGADELFAGYLRYDDFDRPASFGSRPRLWRWLRRLGLAPARGSTDGDLRRYFAYEGCLPLATQRLILDDEFSRNIAEDEMHMLARFHDRSLPAVAAAQRLDIELYLVDHILCKVDRASMAHGVEARVPFLDTNLVASALRVPAAINFRRGERKALLKRIAGHHLPAEFVTSRKKGFSSPLAVWSDARLHTWAGGLLDRGQLVASGVLRPDWRAALEGALGGPVAGSRAGWLLLTAELWARRWILDAAPPLPEPAP